MLVKYKFRSLQVAQHRISDICCLVVQGYPPSSRLWCTKKAGRFQPAGDQMNGLYMGGSL
jgi:hypothetical protein